MVRRELSFLVLDGIGIDDTIYFTLEAIIELASIMMFASALAEGALCLARKRGII